MNRIMITKSPTLAPPAPDAKRVEFRADVQFEKAAPKGTGDLELAGYASTWGIDRDNERVDPLAFDGSLTAYMQRNPIVLWQHSSDQPIGRMTAAEVDATGLLVKATIPKPGDKEDGWKHTAYESIKNGTVRTFSIGGYMDREIKGGEWIITNVELMEVSVVSIPSNPDSLFSAAVKALDDGAKAAKAAQERTDQQVAAEVRTITALLQAPTVDHAAVLEGIKRARALCKVDAPEVTKAGRVLSKSNEAALRDALTTMQSAVESVAAVLAKLPSNDPEGDLNG